VPITLLSTDGTSTSCVDSRAGQKCDDTEQTLDMSRRSVWPPAVQSGGVHREHRYRDSQRHYDAHAAATTIGCSWTWQRRIQGGRPVLPEDAAQGQNFFTASGDTHMDIHGAGRGDPYVVSVGGTIL